MQKVSKKLSKSEVNYSTFDRELLAAVSGKKHFRTRLEGHPFELWTDPKPLHGVVHHVGVTSVAEAYTTQPNRKAGSRVLYVYLACMAG